MAIAGACYLANSAAVILSPLLASMLFAPVLVPAFIGELSFAAWLTVKGVNVAKWKEMAARSRK
jgi:ABC-type microcin C transport system permease subunit YejB